MYQCEKCGCNQETQDFQDNYGVCPQCGHYMTLNCHERIGMVADAGSFKEMWENEGFKDPLSFPGYQQKYQTATEKTGIKEAVVVGEAKIQGNRVMLGVMDTRFVMASMGSTVGEKITKVFEYAKDKHLPVILFVASGGARMQEGVVALMQMAKTASSVSQFSQNGGFYISILTNPTTGGVSASFAMLGDIILAEPNALIGFAGRRVVEQTLYEKLPENFQKAEYLLENGFLDAIITRKETRSTLNELLVLHNNTVATGNKEEKAYAWPV